MTALRINKQILIVFNTKYTKSSRSSLDRGAPGFDLAPLELLINREIGPRLLMFMDHFGALRVFPKLQRDREKKS